MRKIVLLTPALLAACASAPAATPVHGVTPGHKCDATGTDRFIGQPVTRVTGSVIKRATNAAVLAAGAAAGAGPNVAGAAAGKVFAEVDALARRRGGRPETFAGLAGTGDLVATVVAAASRNRRAGELLGQGLPPAEIGAVLGRATEAVDSVSLLAHAARDSRVEAPALEGLAALVEGRIEPERWTATVTEPAQRKRARPVRAA